MKASAQPKKLRLSLLCLILMAPLASSLVMPVSTVWAGKSKKGSDGRQADAQDDTIRLIGSQASSETESDDARSLYSTSSEGSAVGDGVANNSAAPPASAPLSAMQEAVAQGYKVSKEDRNNIIREFIDIPTYNEKLGKLEKHIAALLDPGHQALHAGNIDFQTKKRSFWSHLRDLFRKTPAKMDTKEFDALVRNHLEIKDRNEALYDLLGKSPGKYNLPALARDNNKLTQRLRKTHSASLGIEGVKAGAAYRLQNLITSKKPGPRAAQAIRVPGKNLAAILEQAHTIHSSLFSRIDARFSLIEGDWWAYQNKQRAALEPMPTLRTKAREVIGLDKEPKNNSGISAREGIKPQHLTAVQLEEAHGKYLKRQYKLVARARRSLYEAENHAARLLEASARVKELKEKQAVNRTQTSLTHGITSIQHLPGHSGPSANTIEILEQTRTKSYVSSKTRFGRESLPGQKTGARGAAASTSGLVGPAEGAGTSHGGPSVGPQRKIPADSISGRSTTRSEIDALEKLDTDFALSRLPAAPESVYSGRGSTRGDKRRGSILQGIPENSVSSGSDGYGNRKNNRKQKSATLGRASNRDTQQITSYYSGMELRDLSQSNPSLGGAYASTSQEREQTQRETQLAPPTLTPEHGNTFREPSDGIHQGSGSRGQGETVPLLPPTPTNAEGGTPPASLNKQSKNFFGKILKKFK